MSDPRLTGENTGGRADWSDYRIFGAVVRHGGFNAAARALGMNQAGLSRRVRDLEIRLNVKLLDRRHDGVALTEAGELIFDHVVAMENSATSIEKLVLGRDRKAEGRVVLSTPDGIGGYLIAPAAADFLSENPGIRLSLDCGLYPQAPVSARPDIMLQFERPTDPDIVSEPIAYGHWCLFAAQSYIDLYGMPSTVPQAADHRAVDMTLYGQFERENWTSKAEAFMSLRTVSLESNSSAVVFLAVCHGAGIAPLPSYALAVEPSLVLVDTTTRVTLPLWMCHHRAVAHSARVRRVQDWLRSVFDSHRKPWFRKEFVHPSEFIGLAREHAEALRGRPSKEEAAPEAMPVRSSGL
jgi:DNA-binding transcriptional LysR family regulator